MRLLFDENLSHKLVGILAHEFPGCAHVREIGLRAAEDRQIWDRDFLHYLKKLERKKPDDDEEAAPRDELPPSADIVAEIEQFLRQQRPEGS